MLDTSHPLRLLTGDRPTGSLHLGHYLGSLKQRVAFQDTYESFILIADYHLLTTRPSKADIEKTSKYIKEMMRVYLAVGLNPNKVVFYLQSQVPEVAEITLLFSMLTTVPRLQRIPSLKDMAKSAHLSEMPLGLLGYPVLQSADIVLPMAHIVPVGKDNEAHVELTRELVRRFNHIYDADIPEPKVIVPKIKTLIGTDGNAKMSKSLNNSIELLDDRKTVEKKVMGMFTDPQRIRSDIPGTVENNPVFIYHDAFNPNESEIKDLKERYRTGTVGDVEVKGKLHRAINSFLDPIRERAETIPSGYAEQVLHDGTLQMRKVAKNTIMSMRKSMGLAGVWNSVRRKAEKYSKKNT